MSKFQPVRGTQDFYGDESEKFHRVISAAKKLSSLYNYQNLILPVFEATEVFARSLGETSDVVSKEMFSFQTKGEENVTLRPEFTAGAVRALISNSLQQSLPLKFFSFGPVFRYERPQKGRYRQFNQVNFEYFGNADALADAETIILAAGLLGDLGIENVKLHINTLGDAESRKNYTAALVKYFSGHKHDLSEDSKIRLEKNPLRILDSKDENDKKLIENAPVMQDFLNEESKRFFQSVLKNIEMPFEVIINPKIVRGLDYYNHTVFEFISENSSLGVQNTIIAGGRYDSLVAHMGGNDIPAIGFAGGIERLMMCLPISDATRKLVAVISDNNEKAMETAEGLRKKNIRSEVVFGGNFKKKVQKADRLSASHVVFVFEEGLEVKDMETGEQKKIEDISNYEF